MASLRIPAVFMRGGTSKGLFFHERDLPADMAERDAILLSAFGSPDPYGRQLNGIGGGISSLSKSIVVRLAREPGADVEFLHGQVAVDQPVVDYSANCGNLSAAVGPFAIDEGLVTPTGPDEALLRLRNLNTGAIIDARIPLKDGRFDPRGDFALPGVAGLGTRVGLEYLEPGAGDGSVLFPTGRTSEVITVQGRDIEVTLAQATLPVIWLRAEAIGLRADLTPDALDREAGGMALLEALRRAGAVRMGLAATAESASMASPKIGILAPPADYVSLDGSTVRADDFDVMVRMISMERAHKASPLTGAMCLAAACLSPGTTAQAASRPDLTGPAVRLGTPSGVLTVGATVDATATPPTVQRTIVYSTARRLMEGFVRAET